MQSFLCSCVAYCISRIPEEQQVAIQEYFRTSIFLDAEQLQNGNPNLPGLKKLTMAICKNVNRYSYWLTEYAKQTAGYIDFMTHV